MEPRTSVFAVAVVQFLGSLAILVPFGLFLVDQLELYRLRHYPPNYLFSHPSLVSVLIGLPAGLCSAGIVTSIGLLRVREWARKITLFLSIVPVSACAILVLLRPASVFPPAKPNEQLAILTVGSGLGLVFCEYCLVLLTPFSLWWLILFTRPSIKALFSPGVRKPGPSR